MEHSENTNVANVLAEPRKVATPIIEAFVEEHFEVIIASVCTEDGFVISQSSSAGFDAEPDKLASISSTLFSMCDAAVQNIKSGKINLTFVDAESANLVVRRITLLGKPAILTSAVSKSFSLGQALYVVNRLAGDLEIVASS